MKKMDVAIPVWRPDNRLQACVEGLLRQNCPVRSITLILSVTEPREEWVGPVEEKMGALPGVRIEERKKEQFNHGGTRRWFAEKSDADILLFMTQDAVPADAELTRLLAEALEDPRTAAAYARHVPDGNCDAIERYARYFTYPPKDWKKSWEDVEKSGVTGCFVSNVCAAYRRDWYERAGGFEKNIPLSEDSVLAARAMQQGAAVAYVSQARVIHSHQFSLRTQWKRNFDIGVVHRIYADIFGRICPEATGARLLAGTAGYLMRQREFLLFPRLLCLGAVRSAAYLAGRHYERLPGWLVRRWTSDRIFWENLYVRTSDP